MKAFFNFILFFCITLSCGAQVNVFQNIWGQQNPALDLSTVNRAHTVRQVSDGYLVAGGTVSSSDGMLSKINTDGTWLWTKKIRGGGNTIIFGMTATLDGAYVLAGGRVMGGGSCTAAENMFLTKVNTAGTILWQKSYGGSTNATDVDDAYSVELTPDGGFILAGITESYGADAACGSCHCKADYYIVKTNSDGGLMWNLAWGGTGITHDYAYDIIVSYNGGVHDGYLIVGEARSFPNGGDSYNPAILKINTDGTYAWSRSYDIGSAADPDFDAAYGCVQTANGDYFITGQTNGDFTAGTTDIFLMRLNLSGTLQWTKSYTGGFFDNGLTTANFGGDKLIKTSDGGFAIVGMTTSYGATPSTGNVLLIKTAADGTFSWGKAYGGDYKDIANSVQQTNDGGYVIAATTKGFSVDMTRQYALLIKTNSAGITTTTCAPTTVAITASSLTSTLLSTPYTLTSPAGFDITTTVTTSVPSVTVTPVCSAVLPVELISFTALCDDNKTNLYWSTASELNNNYFTIEKSADGINFEPIGTVPGAGNSNTVRTYEFTDNSPAHSPGSDEVAYYRLKQTDFDGEFEYSPVTSLHLPCRDGEIVVLPNPSSGIFSVGGLEPGSAISVYNVLGEEIVSITADAKFMSFDLADKARGVYFFKMQSGSMVSVSKIIIQ